MCTSLDIVYGCNCMSVQVPGFVSELRGMLWDSCFQPHAVEGNMCTHQSAQLLNSLFYELNGLPIQRTLPFCSSMLAAPPGHYVSCVQSCVLTRTPSQYPCFNVCFSSVLTSFKFHDAKDCTSLAGWRTTRGQGQASPEASACRRKLFCTFRQNNNASKSSLAADLSKAGLGFGVGCRDLGR